jgi:uncharacterized protein
LDCCTFRAVRIFKKTRVKKWSKDLQFLRGVLATWKNQQRFTKMFSDGKKLLQAMQVSVFFHLDGMELSLFNKTELANDAHVDAAGTGFKGFTLAYNTRSEKEVDSLVSSLGLKGITIIKHPQKSSRGGYRGYVTDPYDNYGK